MRLFQILNNIRFPVEKVDFALQSESEYICLYTDGQ